MKKIVIPKLSKRTWGTIAAIILILAAIVGLGLVRFTTSNSIFCLTCHKNQDVAGMWVPSRAHPASVSCVDCHTTEAFSFSHSFSASDDLMNQRCVSCHQTIPGGEKMDLDKVRIVKISHKQHADQKVLCIDCHRNIAHDRGTPRTNRPAMETCYQCHQAHPRTQACDKCHPINLRYTQK